MACGKGLMKAVWAASAAASLLPFAGTFAQTPPAPPASTAPASSLDSFTAVLSNPAATQEQRDEAARRLTDRRTPQSRQLIQQILTDSRFPQSQLAITKALADDVQSPPDPALVDPLFVLLSGGVRPAGWVLVEYSAQPGVMIRLTETATQRSNNEAQRLAAIESLGRVTEKASAATLIQLLTDAGE